MPETTHGPLPPPREPDASVTPVPNLQKFWQQEPVVGSVLIWSNWNRLTGKIAKAHAYY